MLRVGDLEAEPSVQSSGIRGWVQGVELTAFSFTQSLEPSTLNPASMA